MCDTFVALPSQTQNGSLIFAKNSDREPAEAQEIVAIPRKKHQKKYLRTTYIVIDQVAETNAMILSKPFQMWGAEMGLNEHNVVIGNEAVFTKIKFNKNNQGLTGMDLLRLALERSSTAKQALECIISLLEKYGQDACGGYKNKDFFYHNSFIIADDSEAFLLDTAGEHWAYQAIKSFKSISNGLTISVDYDKISDKAIAYATAKGWHKLGETFSFTKAFSNSLMSWAGSCKIRQAHSNTMGQSQKMTADIAMQILSSHYQDSDFAPHKASTKDLCMHASGITNPSQTVGSMVVEIRKDSPATVWLTGTSSPCLSVFMPFFMGGKTLDSIKNSSELPDDSMWWRANSLYKLGNSNYKQLSEIIQKDRVALQQEFLEKEIEILKQTVDIMDLDAFSAGCVEEFEKQLTKHSVIASGKSWNVNYFSPLYQLRFT